MAIAQEKLLPAFAAFLHPVTILQLQLMVGGEDEELRKAIRKASNRGMLESVGKAGNFTLWQLTPAGRTSVERQSKPVPAPVYRPKGLPDHRRVDYTRILQALYVGGPQTTTQLRTRLFPVVTAQPFTGWLHDLSNRRMIRPVLDIPRNRHVWHITPYGREILTGPDKVLDTGT